mgnify:CR=1 FL=1
MVDNNFIDIYTDHGGPSRFNIQPANVKRDWMDETGAWAYHCLPLKIANQYGWVVHCPTDLKISWNCTMIFFYKKPIQNFYLQSLCTEFYLLDVYDSILV